MLLKTRRNNKKKRLGRGGVYGGTSGHGHKGQKSRAGKSIRPMFRDVIQRIPKKRGHNKNRSRTVVPSGPIASVSIGALDKAFDAGTIITLSLLKKQGIVKYKGKKYAGVKILGNGETAKAFKISRIGLSKIAEDKITKAGGTIYTK